MSDNDVYEQWKASRSSITAPSDFQAKAMAEATELPVPKTELKPTVLERPLWATVAIIAASVFGLARVGFALLIGISS